MSYLAEHLPQAREWQQEALARWERSKRGIVAAVTGSGKTALALLCADSWLTRRPDGAVCIIVPTAALQDQWYITLLDDCKIRDSEIALIRSGRRTVGKARFTISIINSARNLLSTFEGPERAMLIVDECHRAGSPENAKALEGDWSATLGLSATPEREYDDGFYRYVAPALGDVIFRYEYPEAFRDGVIVPFDLVNVHFDLSEEEAYEYERLTRLIAIKSREEAVHSNETEDLLRRRARVSWTSQLRVPLAVKLTLENQDQKIIVFHETVTAANEIYRILQNRGVMATVYHTGLAAVRRQENLRQYRRGFYRCLVCCRALDEGLDVPGASIAIIASGTASSRQRIQRLGRVLRSQSGKQEAVVYTLFATDTERNRLAREALRLEGVASVRWLHASVDRG